MINRIIFVGIFIFSSLNLLAADVQLTEILRDETGKALLLNVVDSHLACARNKNHLPSSREFILYAIKHGAKKIVETNFPEMSIYDEKVKKEINEHWENGIKPTFKYNSINQPVVDFYYDVTGYEPESGDEYKAPFWTASTGDPSYGHGYLIFLGDSGEISGWIRGNDSKNYVRCAVGQHR